MRIWFNHWFSTAYHLIELMRKGCDETVVMIGSSSNSKALYRPVCDEWYGEEDLPAEQYVDFCVDFCKQHAVDVFVPRRQLVAIVRAKERFAQIGVRVMAESDPDKVTLLDDKLAAYRFFEPILPQIIPPYRVVSSYEEFDRALSELAVPSERLCYKVVVDEGAKSFRVIDNSIESVGALYAKPGAKVTEAAARHILSEYDFSVPLIVMPYLKGADVSVDCLTTDSGPILIPRFKVGRYSEVKPDAEVLRICRTILDALPLEMPANIQFKMDNGKPYLLEINPRMSGGLQLSCLAAGINLPLIALQKLTGQPQLKWSYPADSPTVGLLNLECPVIVSEEN